MIDLLHLWHERPTLNTVSWSDTAPKFQAATSLAETERLCDELGLPYRSKKFLGTCKGTTEGFPYKGSSEGMNLLAEFTVSFYRSIALPGTAIIDDGEEYVVLCNRFGDSQGKDRDQHEFLIVPTKHFTE